MRFPLSGLSFHVTRDQATIDLSLQVLEKTSRRNDSPNEIPVLPIALDKRHLKREDKSDKKERKVSARKLLYIPLRPSRHQ